MDLLVTLCASHHLNPSDYTVEFLSPNKNNIRFKPNSPVGSLEADKMVLKPKAVEEKIRRPYMPEVRRRKRRATFTPELKRKININPGVFCGDFPSAVVRSAERVNPLCRRLSVC